MVFLCYRENLRGCTRHAHSRAFQPNLNLSLSLCQSGFKNIFLQRQKKNPEELENFRSLAKKALFRWKLYRIFARELRCMKRRGAESFDETCNYGFWLSRNHSCITILLLYFPRTFQNGFKKKKNKLFLASTRSSAPPAQGAHFFFSLLHPLGFSLQTLL